MKKKHKTNEMEFQGEVLTWLNIEINRRKGLGLDKATQEPPKETTKRNDLVIWWNRSSGTAFFVIELKTPNTPINDLALLEDACKKAQRWDAKFFAIWNMQAAELYLTPPPPVMATPADRLKAWETDSLISTVDDWLKRKPEASLRKRCLEILDTAWGTFSQMTSEGLKIDASVFVDKLGTRLTKLQNEILPGFSKKVVASRRLRRKVRAIASEQGFIGFIDNLDIAITGQYVYRLIGQILFYFALRRQQPSLKPLKLLPSDRLPEAFRPFWDEVRRFDYEALFEESDLEKIVPLSQPAQDLIRKLIDELALYDWNGLREDVLGSIFENLIPLEQQLLYGQFFTPAKVADIIVAFTVDGFSPLVLDPGCGSGTFLMRAYDFIRQISGKPHQTILELLWGFDISPFAAELAAINIFRQDLSEFNNFPRVVRGNFFDLSVDQEIPFPPARTGGQDKIYLSIPKFDSIIGNPPYLRSQNQDDLEPNYKTKLYASAEKVGIEATSKTDLFGFFIYRALEFMKPGSRIGFVTSASWLTADFGVQLQRLLVTKLRLVALISSSVESFFSQVDVNAILVIAEKRRDSKGVEEEQFLRFVRLKKKITDLFPDGTGYWERLLDFADWIESVNKSFDNDDFRLKIVSETQESIALSLEPGKARNWSVYLRAPLTYFEIFGEEE